MSKIDSLMIDSFRGIKDLYLENLNNVNLIVGPNNSGKTSGEIGQGGQVEKIGTYRNARYRKL